MAIMVVSRVSVATSMQMQVRSRKVSVESKPPMVMASSRPSGLGSSSSLQWIASKALNAELGRANFGSGLSTVARRRVTLSSASTGSQSVSRPVSQPRFIQHKQKASWFYRFLSIVYNHIANPGHWTEDMRDDALEPTDLNDSSLVVVDVVGGTSFTTLGIVKTIDMKTVSVLDESPHQLEKAKAKAPLKDCKIIEGDAEDLSFPIDYANRYVSH